jgi:hypothetical protein
MAHIKKRERKSEWLVRYRNPAGRVRSRSFARRIDAERFAAAVEADKARGTWTDPCRGRSRIGDWAIQWLGTKVDLRASSRVRLEGLVRKHILPEFGGYPLNRIGNSDVRRWAGLLDDGYSASTVRKAFNALTQMMRSAVSDRRIAFNPCDDVSLPPEHYGEQRFLGMLEVERWSYEIEPRFRAMVLLAVIGGLRFAELAGFVEGGSTYSGDGSSWPRHWSRLTGRCRSALSRLSAPVAPSPYPGGSSAS